MINYLAAPGINRSSKRLTLAEILRAVSDEMGVPVNDIKRRCRELELAQARQVYCYMARNKTKHSLDRIGKEINRHHTTVMHSIISVENYLATSDHFKVMMEALENKLLAKKFD